MRSIEIDACLAEEAVHLALSSDLAHPYWSRRDRIYEEVAALDQPRRFAELSRRMMCELELDAPLMTALDEQGLVRASIRRCSVIPAGRKRNVGAELFVADPNPGDASPARNLVIRLDPESFREAAALLTLLRRELWYIHDMLDPEFGYDPALPEAEGGPMHVELILRRYRILWSTVVHGRLVQEGHAGESERHECLRQFASTFGMLDDRVEQVFAQWFECRRPRHDDLLQFARKPLADHDSSNGGRPLVSICPLCRCPTPGESLKPREIIEGLVRDIQAEYPRWKPSDGACPQCLELYRGRLVALLVVDSN